MRRWGLCGLVLLLAECAVWYPPGNQFAPPEVPHDPATLRRVLDSTQPLPDVPLVLTLRVTPRTVLVRGAVHVVCLVPGTVQRVRFGIEDLRMSDHPGGRLLHEMFYEPMPCGSWVAVCATDRERKEQTVEVLGC